LQQCSLEGVCQVSSQEGDPCGTVEHPSTGESEYLRCSSDLFCELESSTCKTRIETNGPCDDVPGQVDPCQLSADGRVECSAGVCQLCQWIED
jgi:hypothetical protein